MQAGYSDIIVKEKKLSHYYVEEVKSFKAEEFVLPIYFQKRFGLLKLKIIIFLSMTRYLCSMKIIQAMRATAGDRLLE